MKKYFVLFFLSLTILINSFAQNKIGKISGTVTDVNGKAVDAATIYLLRAKDSAMAKVAVSNNKGEYEFEKMAEGKYLVSITTVGLKKSYSNIVEISASQPEHHLPTIQLAGAGKTLTSVTVVGKRPLIENKIDRTVINVEAAPSNAGATALEVLEKSPGITVDNDGNISLKGKQGVIVMMDGKPTYLSAADLANVLRNMPASTLDQIEIMTNPPAKYDAAGNSGIINIKTKKSLNEGLNGSFTVGNTLAFFKRDNSLLLPYRTNNSLNMNYRKGKMNLFGNYNFNYNQGRGELDLVRKFYNADKSLNSIANSSSDFNFSGNNHTLKLGFDYYPNKKNVFGIVINSFGFFGRGTPVSRQVISDPNGTVESILESTTSNKLRFLNYSGNVNYKHTFDSTGREITVDFDYIGYDNATRSLLITDFYDYFGGPRTGQFQLRGDIPGVINVYSVKSDYTHPLKNNMRFDAGFKSSYVKNDNEVIYDRDSSGKWVRDSRSNHFIYEENINAAYVSINKKWKKFSVQTGLRLENTVSTGNEVTNDSSFKRNYTNLFPTAYLNYEVNKTHTLTLSYGRRVQRPNYQDLNPFLWFLDSLTYRQGNPYLLPQFAHNIELRHALKGGFTTVLNFAQTDDVISQILKQYTEKRTTFLTIDNVARFRNMGVAITAPVKPAKWWNMNIFANVFNNKYTGVYFNSFTGKNDPIDLQYTSYLVNISNNFSFKKGWSGELSGFVRGKGVDQLTVADPMYFMTLGGQKTILKGKGTLRMNIRDPFHWQKFSGHTRYSDIDLQVKNRWANRNVNVSFSYRFGKTTVAQARRRASATSEEESRAGQSQQ